MSNETALTILSSWRSDRALHRKYKVPILHDCVGSLKWVGKAQLKNISPSLRNGAGQPNFEQGGMRGIGKAKVCGQGAGQAGDWEVACNRVH